MLMKIKVRDDAQKLLDEIEEEVKKIRRLLIEVDFVLEGTAAEADSFSQASPGSSAGGSAKRD